MRLFSKFHYCISLALVTLFIPMIGRSQQTLPSRGTDAWFAQNRKVVQDAIKEKTHLPFQMSDSLVKLLPSLGEEKEHLTPEGSPEEIVTTNPNPQSEVHAAINPTDTTNIVVSPIKLGSAGLVMPVYYTKDFGKTWKQSTFKTAPYSTTAQVIGGGDPILTYDATGKLYLSWIDLYVNTSFDSEFATMIWASSTDGGATFTRPKSGYIAYEAASLQSGGLSGFNDKEWMTVDRSGSLYRNTLYAAFVNLDNINGAQIRLGRKLPQRDSFEVAVDVSPDSVTNVQYTSIGVDQNGGVHVTYFGTVDGSQYGLYHSLSTDGGHTFQSTVKIANVDIPNTSGDAVGDTIPGVRLNGNYPCAHLSIDTSNEGHRMYLVWCALGTTFNQNHGTDIYFSSSTNSGLTWSTPKVLNDDPVPTLWVDHYYPSIAVNRSGVISVTWYDRRGDPGNDMNTFYYMSQSFNGGETWSKNVPVASKMTDFNTVGLLNGGFGVGEYTQVLTTDNYAIPVWSDGRGGTGDISIYAAFLPISQSGSSVARIENVSSNFELNDLYPNPAAQSATFSYILKEPSYVKLTISNVLGETVSTLEDGFRGAGSYTVPFSTVSLPNGSYYYRLETDFGSSHRNLVIAK
jgi:hypothetical protein